MSIQSVNSAPPATTSLTPRTQDAVVAKDGGATEAVESASTPRSVEAKAGTGSFATDEQLSRALDEVREAVKPVAQSLHFSLDNDTGRTVVKVMDTETNEMIRQIPSEEILKIAQAIDKLQGLLIKQQA